MKGEILGKGIIIILSIAAINWALIELFDLNLITQFLPDYAKWIYIGFGILGGWMLYSMFKK